MPINEVSYFQMILPILYSRVLDRDMATLKEALVKLDEASLQAKRNLTIPFVKSILGL